QRKTVGLDIELAAHRQKRFPAEEVLAEVRSPFRRCRQRRAVCNVERADPEHLAGAFGVARRDDRRVDPEEAVVAEVAMNRLTQTVAYARHGPERVRTRPQV